MVSQVCKDWDAIKLQPEMSISEMTERMDEINFILWNRERVVIDEIISNLDPYIESIDWIILHLRHTFCIRDELKNWHEAVKQAKIWYSLIGEEELLGGL